MPMEQAQHMQSIHFCNQQRKKLLYGAKRLNGAKRLKHSSPENTPGGREKANFEAAVRGHFLGCRSIFGLAHERRLAVL